MKKILFLLAIVSAQNFFAQDKYAVYYNSGIFKLVTLYGDSITPSKENFFGFNGITKKNILSVFEASGDTSSLKKKPLPVDYSSPLLSFSDGKKWALYNWKGEKLTEFKYDLIFPFLPENGDDVLSFDSAFAFASLNGKWGLLNMKGEEVTKIEFDLPFADKSSTGTFSFYIPEKDETECDMKLATCKEHFLRKGIIEMPFVGINIVLIKDELYGAIDLSGTETLPFIYDEIITSKTGNHRVLKKNKWGYINDTGQEIIECKYDKAFEFSDELVIDVKTGKTVTIKTANVKLKGKLITIDETGNVLEE